MRFHETSTLWSGLRKKRKKKRNLQETLLKLPVVAQEWEKMWKEKKGRMTYTPCPIVPPCMNIRYTGKPCFSAPACNKIPPIEHINFSFNKYFYNFLLSMSNYFVHLLRIILGLSEKQIQKNKKSFGNCLKRSLICDQADVSSSSRLEMVKVWSETVIFENDKNERLGLSQWL